MGVVKPDRNPVAGVGQGSSQRCCVIERRFDAADVQRPLPASSEHRSEHRTAGSQEGFDVQTMLEILEKRRMWTRATAGSRDSLWEPCAAVIFGTGAIPRLENDATTMLRLTVRCLVRCWSIEFAYDDDVGCIVVTKNPDQLPARCL